MRAFTDTRLVVASHNEGKVSEIRALLAKHGITSAEEVIAHCQTGIRSSYATLVLQALGYSEVKNYDGSWIEWANNQALPIVNGAEKSQPEEIAFLRN